MDRMSIGATIIFHHQIVWSWIVKLCVTNVQRCQVTVFPGILRHLVHPVTFWEKNIKNKTNHKKKHSSYQILIPIRAVTIPIPRQRVGAVDRHTPPMTCWPFRPCARPPCAEPDCVAALAVRRPLAVWSHRKRSFAPVRWCSWWLGIRTGPDSRTWHCWWPAVIRCPVRRPLIFPVCDWI